MNKAIILHGKPGKQEFYNAHGSSQSNSHWLPWLQQQLIVRGILAQTPELPAPYEPVYEDWKKIFEQLQPDENTILVGHSCGGGFLVRWLSENKDINVGKVVLVAPSLGLDWDYVLEFTQFEIDPDLVNRTKGVSLLCSDDDKPGIIEAKDRFKAAIKNLEVIDFSNKGHFTEHSLQSIEFPELLDIIML